MKQHNTRMCRLASWSVLVALGWLALLGRSVAQPYLDNQAQYSNQDPNNETRRSDHFRMVFGHYNRDSGMGGMTEAMAQGNLQEYEQMWNRWVNEMGLHDINESSNPTYVDGRKYRANFNFLMTWNDGGGGGAYSSADAKGFFYAMGNPGYCRWDPPSGATPHEFGHVWEGSCAGFNGSDSSGAWWECTANWMLLQFLNTYPQAGGYLYNSVFYPAHGRDYYDSWMIWEAAKEDPRYGAAWVNNVWTNANVSQKTSEYILDRMIRCDSSGSSDKAGAIKDLWGDMAKKMVTWDFARQRWLAQANSPWNGDAWEWYTRCRAPLVKLPGTNGWYRPAREHIPQQFGFHFIPLSVTPGTTAAANFQPLCDPVRQSDWRACLVAVSTNGDARYSCLWNIGTNSIALAADENQLYLMVIAVPKPMKIVDPAWPEYTRDSGLQFPYTVAFANANPLNVVYPAQSHTGMHQHANGLGWVANTATVDATAYVGPNAQVLNTVQVRNYARIEEFAVVRNSAQVRDNAVVSGHGMVYENAQVSGNAKVRDWAMVFGYTELSGNAKAIEHAGCGGGDAASHNIVSGDVVMKGVTSVYSPSTFSGNLITDGDTANGGTGDHGVHFGWQWGQNPSIFPALTDNGYQYCGLTFERVNAVFACDQYGINHGYLMNGCRSTIDTGAATHGGYVLPLNGTNQYVELHNSLNDFKDLSVAVWVKWTGSASDQRIWSLGDGTNKVMYLTPSDAGTGGLRCVISNGAITNYLNGTVVPANVWTHVAVVFASASSNSTLYVNGTPVATNTAITLFPDSLNAPSMENANYLGRGNAGNYFKGSLDEFRVYNKALSAAEVSALYSIAAPAPVTPVTDTTAPTPNAATWLVAPSAVSDSAITMSATPGSDASGWVEYYFTCTSGGGHDSGWVSFNKYTDCGLNPGSAYSYTVKMRDQNGNTTSASSPSSATTLVSSAGAASFAFGPIGVADGRITMTATKLTSVSDKVEYKFDRSGKSSGWQASPAWTDTGLSIGGSFTYTVTVRDGRGNASSPSAGATARARDDTAPLLPITVAHWGMLPYATIDNRVSMTAMDASDASGVQYYFHCTAGGASDSGWQDSATYLTPVLADGTCTFQYKLRDKSAQTNESGYSTSYTATIKPTTGYHPCTFAQLTTLPEDNLVTFTGTIIGVSADNYLVRDSNSSATITVKPSTYGQATDLANAFKMVSVSGHLYTYTNSGGRLVSYASLTTIGNPPYSISGTVTNSLTGAPLSGVTVYFSATPNASANPAGVTTTDSSGKYTMPILNGTWYVCAGSSNYVTSTDQTVTVNSANVTNLNFGLAAKPRLSGTVTDLSGAPISAAVVWFSLIPDATANAVFTATTDAFGNYSRVVDSGTYYVAAGASNYLASADRAVAVSGIVTNIDFALPQPGLRNVPQSGQLIFSCVTDPLPLSGAIASWPPYLPAGKTLTAMGTPMAQTAGGRKWASQVYADNDGFRQGTYSSPIAVKGASVVTVVKPKRNGTGTSWTSCVDVFYDRLVLGVKNDTGRICIRRNGSLDLTTAAIPDGQVTVLSLVVQTNGQYKVWANGAPLYTNNTTSKMLFLTNGVAGGYANAINVGRNDPDGWTTFNGNIGDVFLYKVALSDAERQQLETDLITRFSTNATRTITATAGTGGSILPDGTVTVISGTNQSFTITPSPVYTLADVLVDGISQGPIASYTFTNVVTDHTITVSFTPITHVITASAGANGSISPTGAVAVVEGSAQTFTFSPNSGYMVDQVLVDGASAGRANSYTFTSVLVNHTLAVSFKTLVAYTVTATAGTGGSISPVGAVQVLEGWNQTFAITPNTKYAISNVVVDGVNLGNRSSYTFTNVLANHTISASFRYTGRDIPRTADLLFSSVTDTFPASGNTGPWATFLPSGLTLTAMATPAVEVSGGIKWEKNLYADGDGYRFGNSYWDGTGAHPIACDGATIILIAKPTRNTTDTSWTSLVDIFYDRLVLGIKNINGAVVTRVNGNLVSSTATIPSGQTTILSQVVQPDGSYSVWANNTVVMTGSSSAMTNLVPGVSGSGVNGFGTYINVGRNNPDGWTTFNGNIGDVFVYKVALSEAERQQLEADLTAKFINYTITASAGAGGTITPSGAVSVSPGANQAFTIAPLTGYALTNVTVDGVAQGAVGTYTFTNVTAPHSISAAFLVLPIVPPTLTISTTGSGGLDITWPDTYANQLQWSPTLGPGATWSPVGGTPAHVGNVFKVTVTPGSGTAFYGLGP